MNYYNIDSILAEEEKVKVKFPHQIRHFGFYIGPGVSTIRSDTKIDLPFFLVSFLLKNEHCTIEASRYLQFKDDFAAEASIVNLRDTHFFILESNFENSTEILNIFYERLAACIKLIIKDDFTEEDTVLMSYEERQYTIYCRKWFKMFQDFYFRKLNG